MCTCLLSNNANMCRKAAGRYTVHRTNLHKNVNAQLALNKQHSVLVLTAHMLQFFIFCKWVFPRNKHVLFGPHTGAGVGGVGTTPWAIGAQRLGLAALVVMAVSQLVGCGGGDQPGNESAAPAISSRAAAQDYSAGNDDGPLATVALASATTERPQYILNRHNARQPSPVVHVAYNPTGAPTNWPVPAMLTLLQQTANKWTDVCNIRIEITGTTTAQPVVDKKTSADADGQNVVGWLRFSPESSGFSGYVGWWSRTSATGVVHITDADMGLNIDRASRFDGSQGTVNLAGLLAHEWGHMLGLDHSDQVQSVMFANPYNTYVFQNSLRADDAAACAALYGPSLQADAMRVFNWAEQAFPDLFGQLGAASATGTDGHATRLYPATGAALQAQGQTLLFRPPAQPSFTNVGTVADWSATAARAGF